MHGELRKIGKIQSVHLKVTDHLVDLCVDRRKTVGLGEIMFAHVQQNNFAQCGTQCRNFGKALTYAGDGGSSSCCNFGTVLPGYTVTHAKKNSCFHTQFIGNSKFSRFGSHTGGVILNHLF
jgi:hypothetical protein